MILTKGTKEVLVNDVTSAFPLSFFKPGTGGNASKEVAATAADATHLRIKGFGDFFLAGVNGLTGSVLAVRAKPEALNIISVDSTNADQITVSGSNSAGPVTVLLRQRSSDPLPEYIKGDPGRYFKTREYTFAVPANVSAAQFLTRLNTEINNTSTLFPEADEPLELQVSSTYTSGVLAVTCADAHVSLDLLMNDLDARSVAVVSVLKPAVTQANYEGRGLYRNLKGGRWQTEGTNDPYAVPGPLELPVKSGKYTSVSFATSTQRPDLSNHGAADSAVATTNKFMVYIQETPGNEQTIQDLVNWLARADSGVSKTYHNQFLENTTKTLFLSNAAS